MNGDFTRNTFHPHNHFTRVLMQQGRVQVDADWNEQAAIAAYHLRKFITDLVGPHGGPVDGGDGGFQITVSADGELVVGAGRYYVEGLMCENDAAVDYHEQPGYPFDGEPTLDQLKQADAFLLYLDVWERHVSYLEWPGIRDVALGGPDTASRAQLVWQVRALLGEGGNPPDCDAAEALPAYGSGTMRARAKQPDTDLDACVIDPEARYRGAENQLYRVEIHRGGAARGGAASGGATFKWSRENGSVGFPILKRSDTADAVTVSLGSLGRDRRLGLDVGDWVELSDDNTVLGATHPALLVVESVDRDEFEIVLTGTLTSPVGNDPELHPVLRRWDHDAAQGDEGALLVVESADESTGWIDLEDGIQIQFPQVAGNVYRTGDYWLVPARTATGDVEWPRTSDSGGTHWTALPPQGTVHHYAPLAVVTTDANDAFSVTTPDCRLLFEFLLNVNT